MRQDQQRIRPAPSPSPANGVAIDAPARTRRRLAAFPRGSRAEIARLAQTSPFIEDLADSFPGLLFALATGYGAETQRRAALDAVAGGLPLKEAAARLGLPFWLRKLPASAFTSPFKSAPDEPGLVNRLVSLVPDQTSAAAGWLERVLVAHATGGPALTLWVAQNWRGRLPSARSTGFLGVLAWAWYAQFLPSSRGAALLTTRWSATLGAQRAVKEAALWRQRIALDVCLGEGIADTWLVQGTIGPFEFLPLRTPDDLIAEAQVMDNCLDRYAESLEGRTVRIFSVRKDGRSVANLEISSHEREPGHPVITQLRGPHNRRAPIEVWHAAYAWLGSQPFRVADESLVIKRPRAARARTQLAIWGPFLDVLPEPARLALAADVLVKGAIHRSAVRNRAHCAGQVAASA